MGLISCNLAKRQSAMPGSVLSAQGMFEDGLAFEMTTGESHGERDPVPEPAISAIFFPPESRVWYFLGDLPATSSGVNCD